MKCRTLREFFPLSSQFVDIPGAFPQIPVGADGWIPVHRFHASQRGEG